MVFSKEEAQALFSQAWQLRQKFQGRQEQILIHLQNALAGARKAEIDLFNIDLYIGKVRHIITKSGFQVPRQPLLCREKQQILVEGSE